MDRELKQQIMDLPRTRRVEADIPALTRIGEGEPDLLEKIFPFTEVPRIVFAGKAYEEIDGELVEFDFAERKEAPLVLSDTTFRDGQQARPPYAPDQVVDLYRLLGRLSGPNQVISNSEFFLYSDSDVEALSRCLEVYEDNPHYPEPTAWIRGLRNDALYLKLMQHMGLRETGLLSSCSDYHVFLKLKKNWKTAAEEYLTMAKMAAERDIRVRFHLEDVTRANMDGFVLPFIGMIAQFADELPEDLKPKVRLCDTMGFGLPYPSVDVPRSVPRLVHKVVREGIPPERLEWHGHNDFHLVIANAVAAWLYGCDILNGTLLGFGERTGNPPLEGAIIMYRALKGPNGTNTEAITEIADYFRAMGVIIPPDHPFVGEDAHRTRAGIHGHGLAMDERIYQVFDTATLLGTPPSITITDKSGLQGIVYWAQCYLAETVAERSEISVKKTQLVQIGKWVDYQYDVLGRTTGISDEEMVSQLLLHVPEAAVPAYVNKEYGLSGEARVSADDCAPIVGAIHDERERRKQAAESAGSSAPLEGIGQRTMMGLVGEHLSQLSD
ncbi:MAG: 2-isopropylmalate synthase [Candidatus Brocadiaceae bacterium]|jgi:isopropylmalate/homocitrate/citramalate synthase